MGPFWSENDVQILAPVLPRCGVSHPRGAVTAAFSLVGTPVCAPAMALLDIVGMSEAYAELADLQSTVCF